MRVVGVKVFGFDELGAAGQAAAVARVREHLDRLWLAECRQVLEGEGFAVYTVHGAPLAGLGFGVFFNGSLRLVKGAVPPFLCGPKYVADLLEKFVVELTVVASGLVPAGITVTLGRAEVDAPAQPTAKDERAVGLLRQAVHRFLVRLQRERFGPRRQDLLQDRHVGAVLRDPEVLFLESGQLLDVPAWAVASQVFGAEVPETPAGLLPLAARPAVARPAWLSALRLAAPDGSPVAAAERRLALVRAWLGQNEETVALAELEALERAAREGSRFDRALLLLLLLAFDAGRDAGRDAGGVGVLPRL